MKPANKYKTLPKLTCIKCGRVGTSRTMTSVQGTPEIPMWAGRCRKGCTS